MANYAILRFQKYKAGGVAGIDRHNERKKSCYKSNPNIDPERSKDNYHLIAPNGTYSSEYKKRISEVGCRTRSNSTVIVETLITASPEFLEKMNAEEQRQFFTRAADFIFQKIGKQNVISAVVHMDEKTPHMHMTFCPITEDGRLSAKDILGNRQSLSKWQDDFYEHMVQFYPDLSRGLPASLTKRKHIPTYLFKQAEELQQIYPKLMESLGSINTFNAGKKRDEALAFLAKHLPKLTKFSAQIKRTDEYIRDLEEAKKNLESTVADQDAQFFEMEYTVRNLNHEQKKVKDLLKKIPAELLTEFTKNEKTR